MVTLATPRKPPTGHDEETRLFWERLDQATQRTLRLCQDRLELQISLLLSEARSKFGISQRVTFYIPATEKRGKPITLFSCIVTTRTLAKIKQASEGFYGRINLGYQAQFPTLPTPKKSK